MAVPRRRRSVAATRLAAVLDAQLAELVPGERRALDVVDLGGGTGGLALDVARRGHTVTVVDPSPDALASLERRLADEQLAGAVVGRQGDASDLLALLGPASVDVVLCHRVLEVVDDPAAVLAATVSVLRPGGALSLLAAQKHAAVLGHAVAGHVAAARAAWEDGRRLGYAGLTRLVEDAGFAVLEADGIGAVADLVPEPATESPAAWDDLLALETAVSRDPALRAVAPYVHLFARLSPEDVLSGT
ncbi:class I SAM-dependent methyltransferase [Microlunatus flavus]|uniref:Methyltransferase domain-containing protein n=1 Tax=Microlunatus flavus TaxID=1036181 RepID=A0A1H9HGY6_9ACTN|nr:methyltransferase domain-containing protein [Microlunatus flavus]SEQ61486.1 Methyltransferase domain-containing protein [Microlunatus flavus]